ncbi:phosphoglucosamine mutase [Thermosipho ferrireducens]|uniref:Phosphoglucosamine mutase n=1 Tax=Thermosipho ferrireducens TaxID=2571116 RepID=A0ABX7S5M8_9BACT|nr:phosphoglucosamine mutase [Thermosipho ferrireducens]QTA37856.1 phosphoglucosamine mutase [Thermosipho ferrireducens]
MALFGTDGIRGIVNESLTPEIAFRLGNALGKIVDRRVFIGKDTRNSGDLLEAALISGLTSAGVDVYRCGIMPTPALAMITKLEDSCGIMISASHNPPEYNGLKVILRGFKLPDDVEKRIEEEMEKTLLVDYRKIGRVIDYKLAVDEYYDYVRKMYNDLDLSGFKLLVDVANGATFEINPEILESFGAKVEIINNKPDGFNINDSCGSTHPEYARKKMRDGWIGILYDGDGDRCIILDESGKEVHGDKIIGIAAKSMYHEKRLKNHAVVLTILSNIGVEKYLKKLGIKTIRTKVGDRYVLQEMLSNEIMLGGERSGHIIFLDRSTTGDGLITTLEILRIVSKSERTLEELADEIPDYPQVMLNVKVNNKEVARRQEIFEEIKKYEGSDYRVIVRPSGTEPVVRVMVEGKDETKANEIADSIAKLVIQLDNKEAH